MWHSSLASGHNGALLRWINDGQLIILGCICFSTTCFGCNSVIFSFWGFFISRVNFFVVFIVVVGVI